MHLFGLIGFPLAHSFSKDYFSKKFIAEKITHASYENFPIRTIDKLHQLLNNNPELLGLNVTIPYKELVIPFLDEIDPKARAIGAVNVIKIDTESDMKLIGYNTDVDGFTQSLKPLLRLWHKKALILGTGGASKAVAYGLKQLGIDFQYVSREAGRGLTYENLTKEIIEEHTLIINTTPLGMWPDVDYSPNIPYEHLHGEHLLFDLVYNPAKTLFLAKAEENGASIKNGLEMLQIQAEKAWDIWNA